MQDVFCDTVWSISTVLVGQAGIATTQDLPQQCNCAKILRSRCTEMAVQEKQSMRCGISVLRQHCTAVEPKMNFFSKVNHDLILEFSIEPFDVITVAMMKKNHQQW
ncbi:hypothetical protein E2C01_012148 [Portunus trituberculatus]|uniref:Uncharacterized protein n=1 Tax=Portunus trituberculatus TaxID=210409 RepID=A0A5B7DDE0_PORTR|nr:hypothetical protein [Portunus trituberculatus]